MYMYMHACTRPREPRSVSGLACTSSREGGIADELGLEAEPATGLKARKKARDKERRRKKAAARGVRSKELPPEVSALLGRANLAYAQSKWAPFTQLPQRQLRCRGCCQRHAALHSLRCSPAACMQHPLVHSVWCMGLRAAWSRNHIPAPGRCRSNEEVERLLTEVIKRVPNLAEPYQTLGTMCLDGGQPRRALNFFMIAAHLTPKDVHQWRRMAGLSSAQGYLRQAIYCLSKVRGRGRPGRHPHPLPGASAVCAPAPVHQLPRWRTLPGSRWCEW